MLLLGIDFETTGLDPKTSQIIEMGWATYNPYVGTVLEMQSKLLPYTGAIPEEISQLTGLSDAMGIRDRFLAKLAIASSEPASFDPYQVGELIRHKIEHVVRCNRDTEVVLVAHNADFELGFIREHLEGERGEEIFRLRVLDTMKDIPYPDHIKHRDLERLSISHNCVNATYHRALPDVLTMFSILAQYDWDEVYAYWQSPLKTIRAVVGYDDNHKAKACGFQWSPQKKMWLKEVKACDYESLEKKALALALKVVEI